MTVYQKLDKVRVELQNSNLPKSGFNKFAGFKYYELGDFIPTVNTLNEKHGIISIFNMKGSVASLKIVNIENPKEFINFELNIVDAELKGATKIQAHGATNTYMKRYLYLNCYEIVEGDSVDAQPQEDKVVTPKVISVTTTDDKATKEQVAELKKLAKEAKIPESRMKEKYGNFIYTTPFTSAYNKALKEITDYLAKEKK